MLTITHTWAEGTLIGGTTRGDGSAAVLKEHGWRWSRQLGAWYVPRSRDLPVRRAVVEATAAGLRSAGFEVGVEIDDTPRPVEQVEADRRDRLQARAEALAERADRLAGRAVSAQDRASEVAGRVPFGQPILVDHYSAPALRGHYARVARLQDTAVQAGRDADQARDRAASAAAGARHREDPYVVANRIDRLAAEQRKAERNGRAQAATDLAEQVAYWRAVRAEQIDRGLMDVYGPENVSVGDLAAVSGHYWTVTRVNKTTVTLSSGPCQTRVPYHQIRSIRRGGES